MPATDIWKATDRLFSQLRFPRITNYTADTGIVIPKGVSVFPVVVTQQRCEIGLLDFRSTKRPWRVNPSDLFALDWMLLDRTPPSAVSRRGLPRTDPSSLFLVRLTPFIADPFNWWTVVGFAMAVRDLPRR